MSLEKMNIRKYEKEFDHIQCIGKGAFGSVYKARDKLLGIEYAVKRILIPKEKENDTQDNFKRALREAKALAKLDHPNIVKFNSAWVEEIPFDQQREQDAILLKQFSSELQQSFSTSCGDRSSTSVENTSNHYDQSSLIAKRELSNSTDREGTIRYLFIQMELCHKENLKDWLFSDKRTLKSSRNIFSQILNAVAYMHRQNLIHRDLKPNNIFFSSDDTIKVGDFGLVAYHSGSEALEHTGDVGTELYMSPELIAGKPYSCKVDVYALGIIFYELLERFSTEMERVKTLQDIRNKMFPADFKRDFPIEHKVIECMLFEDPKKRIPAARIMKKLPTAGKKSDLEFSSTFIPTGLNFLPKFTAAYRFYLPILICKNQINSNIDKTLESDGYSLFWLTERRINCNFPSFAGLKKAGAVALITLSFRQSLAYIRLVNEIAQSIELNGIRSYMFQNSKHLLQPRVWYIKIQTDIKFITRGRNKCQNINDQKIIKLVHFTDKPCVNELKCLPDSSQVREESAKVIDLSFQYERSVSFNRSGGILFKDRLNSLNQPLLEIYL